LVACSLQEKRNSTSSVVRNGRNKYLNLFCMVQI